MERAAFVEFAAVAAASLLTAAASLSALGEEPDAPPVALEPIIVTAPVPPLDRSLRLLRLLVEQSAPCLGCDAVLRQPRVPPARRLLAYLLLPAEPPAVDDTDRLLFDIKLQDSPELEFLRP